MPPAERKTHKRKRRYNESDNQDRDDSAEEDWFSSTQASLGLKGRNNQRPNAGTSSALKRMTSYREDDKSEKDGTGEPGPDSVQYEWEYRRLQKKKILVESLGAGTEQAQGAGLVIWDEDESAGFDTVLTMRCVIYTKNIFIEQSIAIMACVSHSLFV